MESSTNSRQITHLRRRTALTATDPKHSGIQFVNHPGDPPDQDNHRDFRTLVVLLDHAGCI